MRWKGEEVNSSGGLAVLVGQTGSTPVLNNKRVDWAKGSWAWKGCLGCLCLDWIWFVD